MKGKRLVAACAATTIWLMGSGIALVPQSADAVLTIRITKGVESAQPIAVVPFGWAAAGAPPTDIAEIVGTDLLRTGLFKPVPRSELPSTPSDSSELNFSTWRLLGAPNLLIGRITPREGDRYSVEFRLYDVLDGRQLTGYRLDARGTGLRRVAHQISDIVYEQLTGTRGAFDTRIAYVTESRAAGGESRYTLNVADSDGFSPQVILQSRLPILSPAWSPDGNRLAYVSFEGERARIFVQRLDSGEREAVSSHKGINGAPAWSPDGNRLAMTLSKDGNPEIYVLDLRTQQLQRMTRSKAIDTEPAWTADGSTILFTSDRGGGPQIYRQSVNGGGAQRVTFEGSYNARPEPSPDGKKLAFVHRSGGAYRIAVLDFETNAMQVLTETSLDESPSFAPNGSMVLYSTTEGGVSALAAVSTDGSVRQQLAEQRGKVREPKWSPFRAR
ncbi:MAG: Tol-Pal system beta propeller repeat protein TolB [Gammaproteobacteria bacterium]